MGLPPFSISGYTAMGLLTDRQIQSASHRPTEYFLSDGEGLFFRVRPTRKVWIYRYKQDGREVKLGLGRYPVVSLAEVRLKARHPQSESTFKFHASRACTNQARDEISNARL
jgi:hypothetical protein